MTHPHRHFYIVAGFYWKPGFFNTAHQTTLQNNSIDNGQQRRKFNISLFDCVQNGHLHLCCGFPLTAMSEILIATCKMLFHSWAVTCPHGYSEKQKHIPCFCQTKTGLMCEENTSPRSLVLCQRAVSSSAGMKSCSELSAEILQLFRPFSAGHGVTNSINMFLTFIHKTVWLSKLSSRNTTRSLCVSAASVQQLYQGKHSPFESRLQRSYSIRTKFQTAPLNSIAHCLLKSN